MLLSRAVKGHIKYTVLVSKSFSTDQFSSPNLTFIKIGTSLRERIKAEMLLARISSQTKSLFCFGNLPPVFQSRADQTFIYIQNKYVISRFNWINTSNYKSIIRSVIEKCWFCLRASSNYTYLVQTPTMLVETRKALKTETKILLAPFFNTDEIKSHAVRDNIGYIYISSLDPHKNHDNLLIAWNILKSRGLTPKLTLITGNIQKGRISKNVFSYIESNGLNVEVKSDCNRSETLDCLGSATALIFPSLLESFGMPLIEASYLKKKIFSSDKPYVKDVCTPTDTFNPLVPESITDVIERDLKGQYAPPNQIELKFPDAKDILEILT